MRSRLRWLAVPAVLAMLAVQPVSSAQAAAVGSSCPSDFKGFPAGTATESAWAQQRLDFQQVWPITRGAGVVVAVIDSGVDFGHVLMRGVKRVPGLGFTTPAGTADCYYHGTAVASEIAAQPTAGFDFTGVAPDATIMPIKEQQSQNDGNLNTVARAIRAAVDATPKVRVINLSLNGTADVPALRSAVAYAEAHSVVIVCAANNDGQQADAGTPYPAAYPTVLAVAGTDRADQRADFSHPGSFVDLAAPGDGVEVATPVDGGRTFYIDSGTSFAAPLVAGVAALVIAAHPNLTAAQVRQRLTSTADAPPGKVPSRDVGYGVVNPYLAVTSTLDDSAAPAPATRPAPIVPPVALASSGAVARHRSVGVGLSLLGLAALAAVGAGLVRRTRRG